ncbi:MAG: hypothetical protein IPG76_10500 [Acidobacteria bacterium]|nr:hypothetical protein [Acidobacteriota bacterium]
MNEARHRVVPAISYTSFVPFNLQIYGRPTIAAALLNATAYNYRSESGDYPAATFRYNVAAICLESMIENDGSR